MFNDCSVFILSTESKIFRLEIDRSAQIDICATFSTAVEMMLNGKTMHDYEINYKPEDDEYLCIKNFCLPELIKNAIRTPIVLDSYQKTKSKLKNDFLGYPKIKAIFVGECIQDENGEHFNIAFQKFRKEQNFSAIPHRLILSNDTFIKETNFEIGINSTIDCLYTDNLLQFVSFYYARQVFDLTDYYRSASDLEVAEFTENVALKFEDVDAFTSNANSYVRRKIAMINDSKVLKNYAVQHIKSLAKKSHINIEVKERRIFIPADKDSAIAVLAFLDEEAYRGPFTNSLLIANSKRILK